MKNILRKWDVLTPEKKQKLAQEIIDYFENERDQKIGLIAAEEILDFFIDILGSEIYNKGVEDSKSTIKQGFENLEVDLDQLFHK